MRLREQQQHVPRETFIALRARREVFRIASDFLYRDDAPSPSAPLPVSPLEYEKPPDRATPTWLRRAAIVVLTAMFCVLAIFAFIAAVGL